MYYLGTILSKDGRVDKEIQNRVRKAMNAYYAMSQTIFGKKEVNKTTKCRLYNAILEPILLYGCGSWASQDKHMSKVNSVQMKVLRRIVGKTKFDRIRNDKIRMELNQTPITHRIVE